MFNQFTGVLFFFLFSSLGSTAQIEQSSDTIDLTSLTVKPEHYIVLKTSSPLVIDGKGDEEAWQNAPFTADFGDITGTLKPQYKTAAKLLWDDNYLYVYAELEEPHVWGDIEQRDEVIFYNNDFEVFIDPSGDTRNYGEIEINALNTVWDLLLDQPYRVRGKANNQWNLDDLKTAVFIDGTLNNPKKEDKKWSVEMAIPMKALIALKDKPTTLPKEGELWRLNFSRVQWQHEIVNGKYQRKKVKNASMGEENWSWSNQKAIDMHRPEMWGYIQFSEKTSGPVTPIVDQNLWIKQGLYALFRETRYGPFITLQNNHIAYRKNFTIQVTDNLFYEVEFLRTTMGFEYSLKDPVSRHLFIMNEMGRLVEVPYRKPIFTFATWAHGDNTFNYEKWNEKLESYKAIGISEVLVGGSPEFLEPLIELAAEKEMRIHAWMWTLNRPNDSIAMQHPDWYAVNRNGENSLEYRAYVDYYQWLSPFHPEARAYIKSNIEKLTKLKGLASIHFDYVRYVDVILGAQLQPKYNLVQETEMPEFDYGYHPIAREQFKAIFGYDPIDLKHPELSAEWRQFRLNAITSLVNECIAVAHDKNIPVTAAVFPFPEMSRHMVRQAWDDWNLNAAYPMLYQNFYNESVDWIGFATKTDVSKVDFPIHSGLYIPGLETPEKLESAIRNAHENGASGVSIFEADNLSDDQRAVVKKLVEEFNSFK